MKSLGQGFLASGQQMVHALACQLAVQVAVPGRPTPLLRVFILILVFHAHVGILDQRGADVWRAKQMKLHTRVGGTVGIQALQHFHHPLIGASLGHEFEHEAEPVMAIDEQLLAVDIGTVR